MDKPIGKLKLLTTDGKIIDAILYCHQETTTIGGTTYYLLKLNTPADASGTTLSASTGSVARVVWGKFVYPLTGIQKILSATIYATYRAYTGGGTVNAEIDIKILQSNGTVRTTIATGVSKSANLGSSWATYTGANYSFAGYTVVADTDYLEIDYVANVTAKKASQYAYLRIDDNTLGTSDQTRSQEWAFAGVSTLSATNVDTGSAYLNGQINGTETMTTIGFEWGTQSGNYPYSWTETGTFEPGSSFSHQITGLNEDTDYYFRAKAYNSTVGWVYGIELSFHTASSPGSKYLLTNDVIETEIWNLSKTNPSYSTDTTTKATVGTSPQCTYFKLRPGVNVTASGDFPDLKPFSEVATLTLATGENTIVDSVIVGSYMYVACYTSPGKIVKIDLSTFSKVSTLTLATGEDYPNCIVASGTDYLYVGLNTYPGKIVKISLLTFSEVSTLTVSNADLTFSLVVSGNYLYAGMGYPGMIVKIDLLTFSIVSTLTASGVVKSMVIDGNYLYAVLQTAPGNVIKIDLSTFSSVDTITLATGEDYPMASVVYSGYLYVGCNPGINYRSKIVKIDLSTFSRVATLTLDSTEVMLYDLVANGYYLYAGLYTSPGNIVIIDLTTFSRDTALMLSVDNVGCLAISGNYMYAGLGMQPGRIVKITISVIDSISGWRSPKTIGDFPSGTWTFNVKLVNNTSYSFSVKVAVRLSKAYNSNGYLAYQIGVSESPNTITLSPNGSATDSWTCDLPSITLDNEYLFVEYRIHIESPASATSAQCSFVCDEDPSVAEESIMTSLYTPAVQEIIVAKDYPMVYLPTPVDAKQLTSKVSGATIQTVNRDLPITVIKKGKASELKSKFQA
jgi:hypothetical protein